MTRSPCCVGVCVLYIPTDTFPQLITVRGSLPREKESQRGRRSREGPVPPPVAPFERRACATRRPQGGAAGGERRARAALTDWLCVCVCFMVRQTPSILSKFVPDTRGIEIPCWSELVGTEAAVAWARRQPGAPSSCKLATRSTTSRRRRREGSRAHLQRRRRIDSPRPRRHHRHGVLGSWVGKTGHAQPRLPYWAGSNPPLARIPIRLNIFQ